MVILLLNELSTHNQSLKAFSILYLVVLKRKFASIHAVEVGMEQRHLSRDPPGRVQGYKSYQEVKLDVLQAVCMFCHRNSLEFGEGRFHVI